jgi:hypothetical protein
MMVYLVVEPGRTDETDTVLAVYRTRAAAEAHQQAGGFVKLMSRMVPLLEIDERTLLDAYTPTPEQPT